MEGKETLSIKRTLYNVGTQHNKLTTMVMVCLNEIEKLKKEIKELKSGNVNYESSANDVTPSVSSDIETQAHDILKQLNISN